jgi:hypothetical protein
MFRICSSDAVQHQENVFDQVDSPQAHTGKGPILAWTPRGHSYERRTSEVRVSHGVNRMQTVGGGSESAPWCRPENGLRRACCVAKHWKASRAKAGGAFLILGSLSPPRRCHGPQLRATHLGSAYSYKVSPGRPHSRAVTRRETKNGRGKTQLQFGEHRKSAKM